MLIGQNVRNKLINADFSIWQRGTSFNLNTQVYTADRWLWDMSPDGGTAATGSISRVAYPGADQTQLYIMRINNTTTGTSLGVNSKSAMTQRIEDVKTFAGKTVTVSLWIASTIPNKVINVFWNQFFGSGGSLNAQGGTQITLTGGATLTRYDVTFSIPSIVGKTIGATNLLSIGFFAQQGSAHAGAYGLTSVNWQATGNIDVYRMQVNEGGPADFELAGGGTFSTELTMCQRYYEKSYNIDVVPGSIQVAGASGGYFQRQISNGIFVTKFVTRKRTSSPVITIYAPHSGAINRITQYPSTNIAFAGISTTDSAFDVTSNDASTVASLGWHWTADAEL